MKKTAFRRMSFLVGLAASAVSAAPLALAAPPAVPQPDFGTSAGAQLNQSRQYFHEQEVKRRLKEEREQERDAKVEGKVAADGDEQAAEVSFTLKSVKFDQSSVLSEADLAAIAAKYAGREIKIADLYALVGEVNALYQERGYVVCRAYLPPQTITGGEVHIGLVEGRTGEITVEGNKSTAKKFITGRVRLRPGEVSNLNDLNKSLLWFNGTNDVQLRIRLQAGKEPGTTDYVITAVEPKPAQYVYALVDNAGSETTGFWRYGLGYANTSLFKHRDQLSVGGLISQGSKSGSVSYSLPVTKQGTRLGVNYSANKIKVSRGAMEALGIEGESSLLAFNISQPLAVTPAFRLTAFAGCDELNSRTDLLNGRLNWTDDKIKHVLGGLRFTHYGKNSVLYHEHTYSNSDWSGVYGAGKKYSRYNLNLIGQRLIGKRQLLTLRANMQLTGDEYINSSDQFYIGGVNSVRGYKENILSGDKGYSMSLEYSIPQGSYGEWLGFFDYGKVSGVNAYDDDTLFGAGVGYRHKFGKKLTSTLLFGVPLKKEINGQSQSSLRVHFALFGQF